MKNCSFVQTAQGSLLLVLYGLANPSILHDMLYGTDFSLRDQMYADNDVDAALFLCLNELVCV